MTEGEIGALFEGKEQVGGVLGWEMEADLSNINRPRTVIVARAFWLFGDINLDRLSIALYKREINRLDLMFQDTVTVTNDIGAVPEDTLIVRPIEMELRK